MKKILFLLLLLISFDAYPQTEISYFEWQPNGTMLTKDGSNFVIVDFPNKSKELLYNEILVAVSSMFNSPQHTLSSVQDQLISINAIQAVQRESGGMIGTYNVNFHYVLKIHIKDNKVKIDAPYFTLVSFEWGATQPDIEGWTKGQKFFDAEGNPNPKKQRGKFCYNVNKQFNDLINSILNYSHTQEDW